MVDGENDLPFCLVPENMADAVQGALYPNTNTFGSYTGKGAGHALNLHYVAESVYKQIFDFLKSNGF